MSEPSPMDPACARRLPAAGPEVAGPARARPGAAAAPAFHTGDVATADYVPRLARLDRCALALWAAGCAERVLASFEDRRPGDGRPRAAIEAARAWAAGALGLKAARGAAVAAHAAAREAEHAAAIAAARAAGHAAATAHARGHARSAAAYAVVAAIAAAPADARGAATEAERAGQLALLPPGP